MPIFGMHLSLVGIAEIRSLTWHMLSQLILLRLVQIFSKPEAEAGKGDQVYRPH